MLAKHRMALHQIPEIGFLEFETKKYLYEQVKNLGAVIHEVGETGLVLYFDNQKEHTLAFRSDIDALPIEEETGLPFASTHPGFMHACGHDGHMAMLLGLSEYVASHLETLLYNIVLIFQPSEEISGGAKSIVDSGLLDRYAVNGIFGFHLWPGLEEGKIFSRPGPLMAQSSETEIQVIGKAAHIASSSQGIDALEIMARLLVDIYDYDQQLPSTLNHLLKFGQMTAGTIRNIIASEARAFGSIRSYSSQTQQRLKHGLAQLAKPYEDATGASIEFYYNDGYPAVINDETLFKQLAIIDTLNELEVPVLQAEDFGVYTEHYPCVFFFLGVGDVPALHNPKFDFNMEVLEKGVEFYKKILSTPKLFSVKK